jgi:cytochrome c-type biogenesis protein CcmE
MTRKRRRLIFVVLGMLALGSATALVLTAFQDNLVFFFSPSDLAAKTLPPERPLRVGGLVEQGSFQRTSGSPEVRFKITDMQHTIPVVYAGLLPDLFREGQGVIVQGKLGADGVFRASEVLAKHDENYMPPEVADALKRAGHWQEGKSK